VGARKMAARRTLRARALLAGGLED